MLNQKRDAGWSSLVARRAHNPKVGGSNPPPATKISKGVRFHVDPFFYLPGRTTNQNRGND